MKKHHSIEALMQLGLTFLQATVYCTLLKFGKAEIKAISENCGVARADVYRVMATLEHLGLVEKIISKPVSFKVTPIRDACLLLLENKKRDYLALKKLSSEIIHSTPHYCSENCDVQPEFSIISSGGRLIERITLEDNNTQKSLDIFADWKSIRSIEYYQRFIHEKALKRGVKIRIITEIHQGEQFEDLYPSLFKYNGSFEVRYVDSPIPIRCAIYDKKQVNLNLKPKTDPQNTSFLWSSNPEFVKVIVAFFEQNWEKSHLPLKVTKSMP